jgi:hypothetical protein
MYAGPGEKLNRQTNGPSKPELNKNCGYAVVFHEKWVMRFMNAVK